MLNHSLFFSLSRYLMCFSPLTILEVLLWALSCFSVSLLEWVAQNQMHCAMCRLMNDDWRELITPWPAGYALTKVSQYVGVFPWIKGTLPAWIQLANQDHRFVSVMFLTFHHITSTVETIILEELFCWQTVVARNTMFWCTFSGNFVFTGFMKCHSWP